MVVKVEKKIPCPRMYERKLDINTGYGIDISKLGI